MLSRVSVRNIVLIDRLELELGPGLTVLTGETGAGKSILLDALGLALGSRANTALIGPAGEMAMVSANFEIEPDHPAWRLLAEAGIEPEESLILRRQLHPGKSTAHINDMPVSNSLLRQLGDMLVEIQGQFEGRGLLDSSIHGRLLDRFAAATEALSATRDAWSAWKTAEQALDAATLAQAEARLEEEWLRDAVSQLDSLAPEEGEEEQLVAERNLVANAARIMEALAETDAALNHDGGAISLVARSSRSLEKLADKAGGRLLPLLEALGRADAELAETSHLLRSIEAEVDANPQRLMDIEDRLHALRAQARKHQTEIEELPQLHRQLMARLTALDDSGGNLASLVSAAEAGRQNYRDKAATLTALRQQAAARLDRAVLNELPALKLEQARFSTSLETLEETHWGPEGTERVRFTVSTNPGMPLGPLDKIASGGELARFLLALKVVLADGASPQTLIFDEVDAGVGGAVAAAVGDRLARLGLELQSLVITHSPQVASRGRYHFRITKQQRDGVTISTTEALETNARIEEISRMLAGTTISAEARAAAIRLLEQG